jgi:hypothetical protein
VSINKSIKVKLGLINPPVANNMFSLEKFDNALGFILIKSLQLIMHSLSPFNLRIGFLKILWLMDVRDINEKKQYK